MGVGRRPKPTAIKELEGNPGKRPLNRDEPQPNKVAPEMPKGMAKAAQREWRRIVPKLLKLGLLSEIDGKSLSSYCDAVAIIEAARKQIKEHRQYYVSHYEFKGEIVVGEIKTNPAVADLLKATAMKKSFEIEFGLTPASRTKFKVDKGPAVDPLEELLGSTPQIVPFPAATKAGDGGTGVNRSEERRV